MSSHLPECPIQEHWDSNWDCPTYCDGGCESAECICPTLRACEQRVREGWYEVQSKTWDEGYKHGLGAAREAVKVQAPVMWSNSLGAAQRTAVWIDDAVAAIDALRGEA